jgi:hypothetical protein
MANESLTHKEKSRNMNSLIACFVVKYLDILVHQWQIQQIHKISKMQVLPLPPRSRSRRIRDHNRPKALPRRRKPHKA